jgi:hypothetical protein
VPQLVYPRRLTALVSIALLAMALLALTRPAMAATIEEFIGSYSGSAELEMEDGSSQKRDMSVDIQLTKAGFSVEWASSSYKPDGRVKVKSYSILFIPTEREGVFAAAMRRNVFGHEVQLDPMKGEPFVWSHLHGDTLTVYSLFIDDLGEYEIQQFDRTLVEGGLQLDFKRIRNGEKQRSVTTFLKRE